MGKFAIKEYFFNTHFLVFSLVIGMFFILIGREDSIWPLFIKKEFYLDLFFVTVIVFLLVLLIKQIDFYLHSKFSWHHHFLKRLFYQVAYAVFGVLLVSILLVFLYMEFLLLQDMRETTYFYYELPISLVVIVLVNLMLIIQYLVYSNLDKVPTNRSSTVIQAQKGKTNIFVQPDSIAYIEKEADISFIFLSTGERLVYSGSLEDLSQLLDARHFFRSNRQTIVNRENCKSYETERSGRVILTVKFPQNRSIPISQKKAREFKNWMNGIS